MKTIHILQFALHDLKKKFLSAITKLKIGRRQFLLSFLVESNKCSQPIAYWPLTSPTSELVVPIFTELPNPVGISVSFRGFFCFFCYYWVAYGQTQSRSAFCLFVFFSLVFFFFSVSVKVLPVTPLVSGVFVHRAFCEYFLRIERVVELRRFLWWTQ